MRLLIVDDDVVFGDELANLLREDGHAVEIAGSVPKALEWLEGQEADLVLTDLRMPRRNGLELLREVRARWPMTLVIMITGYATIETALEAMKLGAFDYLRKPFRADQLRAALDLAAQERSFTPTRSILRDPLREAAALVAEGKFAVLFVAPDPVHAPAGAERATLDPAAPARLVADVQAFVGAHSNAAVVIDGIDRMLEHHRLADVVAALARLRGSLHDHGPLRVAFDPARLSPGAATAIAAAVASDETQATLEALANPIRRRALSRLEHGSATFGELLVATGLDDSPKLAFHLRKLQSAGVVGHEDDAYRLTRRGHAAVRLADEAALLPAAGPVANQAFAHPTRVPDPARDRP